MTKELLEMINAAEEYKTLFAEMYNTGEIIYNENTGEVFEAEDGEEFLQCWADTTTRRKFPLYWFVSDRGNLLSVKKDRIRWLNKNKRSNSEKISYKFMEKLENGTKNRNIEAHNLVGLVWGAEPFGLAAELLEEKGLDAFGVNNKEKPMVQGDHVNGNETDNSPGNIQFVTDDIHVLIGNAPGYENTGAAHYKHMQKLGKVMEKENPSKTTVVFTGDVCDSKTGNWSRTGGHPIFATDKLQMSEDVMKQSLYAMYIPSTEGRQAYEELLKTPGEEEKLNVYTLNIYKNFKEKAFYMVYKNIELSVLIIDNK